MSDLRDFLENIRKYSPKIGDVAMRHVSKINRNCEQIPASILYCIDFILDTRTVNDRS